MAGVIALLPECDRDRVMDPCKGGGCLRDRHGIPLVGELNGLPVHALDEIAASLDLAMHAAHAVVGVALEFVPEDRVPWHGNLTDPRGFAEPVLRHSLQILIVHAAVGGQIRTKPATIKRGRPIQPDLGDIDGPAA